LTVGSALATGALAASHFTITTVRDRELLAFLVDDDPTHENPKHDEYEY